ncbi:MAG: P-II family nitrogen regulator [Oscillospiraceae bacterium]|nr:P-II family nitrogen regulator [Ruminococcus sp.]MBQ7013042.1 P-II family nitrogen regulator [Oscillospiraceae bacterium]
MNSQYKLVVTIADYSLHDKLLQVMRQYTLLPKAATHGQGFADSELLEVLGFSENRKAVALFTMDHRLISGYYEALETSLRISKKGMGIAFTVPVSASSGFCGKLMQLTAAQALKEGTQPMAEQFQYTHELIIAIVTRGNAEQVKEAAKKSGARGGTMLHGLGMGGEEAARFLGISIQEEKDVVMMVVPREDRAAVMQAIVDACGIENEARGICFSMPVDSAVGLR